MIPQFELEPPDMGNGCAECDETKECYECEGTGRQPAEGYTWQDILIALDDDYPDMVEDCETCGGDGKCNECRDDSPQGKPGEYL